MATTTLPRPPAAVSSRPARLRSLIRGNADDPPWARPLLIALLAVTLIAYLIDLTASGYSNSFYAAAVQAATRSWKAFFFGAIDSSSFITVDKPPASLWVMALSGRLFGFSSASMLVPQVLEGVLSVALLAAAVKRWFGAGAGLLAGLALAVTPVAALMFRFNNPDALMVCLMTASAYCLVRALEGERTRRWMLGVGALLGFAFLAKMMEAFLVVPGFALLYLIAGPVALRRRVSDLLLGGAAMLAGCGWWVAIVELWPADARPMIDGSPDNSILNLIFGYNGLGRLSGGSGGGGSGANFSGATGALRLFNDVMGGQASWLLPAAVVVLLGGLAWRIRAPRTDRLRAALLLWGSWLVVSGAVFSFSSGVIHTYYTVELAPALAALFGLGAAVLWQRRQTAPGRTGLAAIIAATAAWAVILLQRTPSWDAWLTPLVIVTALASIGGLLAPAPLRRRVSSAIAVCAITACLAAPLAYTADTLASPHTGSVPSAGPTASDSLGAFGGAPVGAGARVGGGALGAPGRAGGAMDGGSVSSALVTALKTDASKYRWVAATSGSQSAASLELASGGEPVMAIGGFSGQGGNITLAQFKNHVKAGRIHYYVAGGGAGGGGFGGGGFGGVVGGGAQPPSGAAGSMGSPGPTGSAGPADSAESGIGSLFGGRGSSESPPIGAPSGGFPGGGSSRGRSATGFPGARAGGPGPGQSTQAITSWVKVHYKAVRIGGQTVYDLTQRRA